MMPDRDVRQLIAHKWCARVFGVEQSLCAEHRAIRFLEEAVELFQACGGSTAMAEKIVASVMAKPVGEPFQELGGVGVTLLALAASLGMSADGAEDRELYRCQSKPDEWFRERNQKKVDAGFVAPSLVKP